MGGKNLELCLKKSDGGEGERDCSRGEGGVRVRKEERLVDLGSPGNQQRILGSNVGGERPDWACSAPSLDFVAGCFQEPVLSCSVPGATS